jgi:hypothetical protein
VLCLKEVGAVRKRIVDGGLAPAGHSLEWHAGTWLAPLWAALTLLKRCFPKKAPIVARGCSDRATSWEPRGRRRLAGTRELAAAAPSL